MKKSSYGKQAPYRHHSTGYTSLALQRYKVKTVENYKLRQEGEVEVIPRQIPHFF